MGKEHTTVNKDANGETGEIDLLRDVIEESLHIECGPLVLNAIRDERLRIDVVIGPSTAPLDLFEIN